MTESTIFFISKIIANHIKDMVNQHKVMVNQRKVMVNQHKAMAKHHKAMAKHHKVMANQHKVMANLHKVTANQHKVMAKQHKVMANSNMEPMVKHHIMGNKRRPLAMDKFHIIKLGNILLLHQMCLVVVVVHIPHPVLNLKYGNGFR